MVLVAYSDSEASDSEVDNQPPASTSITPKPVATSKPTAHPAKPTTIVDRTNPRKIRVALLDTKPENADPDADADGPARKKPRVGAGAFAGFNSLLPPPKRTNAAVEQEKKKAAGAAGQRKVFSLKTGAAPGFDRGADEEMRREMAFAGLGGGVTGGSGGNWEGEGSDDTIPKAGSLREEEGVDSAKVERKTEVVLKGNPMMFKPLSVARSGQKKKKTMATIIPPPVAKEVREGNLGRGQSASQPPVQAQKPIALPPPAPKPKVSLFSLSSEETTDPDASAPTPGSAYEPLVHITNKDAPAADPAPETEPIPAMLQPSAQTLDYIADDLNLSRSQRRQLFGRNADASKSRILHFNTDAEYAANQEMAHKDLAAAQHNPVRAIAPGKHTLQQLVNAASSQKEALEESFASGKRNKKEAGARYGW
ncbi:mitotic checkpoint regulator, MAD2B-interacting-domain-containing protein [Aspergillus granulosus]|uniref:Mitotic checkpoint regulator, MAD2B-interacting-domain-containing protein n=1 Tax=Aspergillus granulosus TaxID=176169 RepID=A0ABR4I034_9EURO